MLKRAKRKQKGRNPAVTRNKQGHLKRKRAAFEEHEDQPWKATGKQHEEEDEIGYGVYA